MRDEHHRQPPVFDDIGQAYEVAYHGMPEQLAALRWLTERLDGRSRVLDLGCGTGEPSARTLSQAGHDVVGVDVSATMLAVARERLPDAELHHLDIRDFHAEPGSFDAALAFFCLLMIPPADIAEMLTRIAGWLRPGGYFQLAMVPVPADYETWEFMGQQVHVTGYPADELAGMLESRGLRVVFSELSEFQPRLDVPPEPQHYLYCRKDG